MQGENLHDLSFGNRFLKMTLEATIIKKEIDKLDFTKTKNFCASED